MRFKSVLKKIGEVANAASAFVPVYGAAIAGVTALIPGDKDDAAVAKALAVAQDGLVVAQNIVVNAEAAGAALALPGAQKAVMTAPALHQLLMALPLLKGKKPKDPAAALEKAKAVGGALADYFNEFED